MPLLLVFLLVLMMAVLFVVMLPLGIVQRYRGGTARRRARGWIVTINLAATLFSSALFLTVAALSNLWIPRAFVFTAAGLGGGLLLGVVGLLTSRWETTPQALHYTPNRWLILTITVVVAIRLGYGFWRGWNAWSEADGAGSWIAASGAAGSMAAGAVVLGYYVVYWAGVRSRIRRHSRLTAPSRHMRRA